MILSFFFFFFFFKKPVANKFHTEENFLKKCDDSKGTSAETGNDTFLLILRFEFIYVDTTKKFKFTSQLNFSFLRKKKRKM